MRCFRFVLIWQAFRGKPYVYEPLYRRRSGADRSRPSSGEEGRAGYLLTYAISLRWRSIALFKRVELSLSADVSAARVSYKRITGRFLLFRDASGSCLLRWLDLCRIAGDKPPRGVANLPPDGRPINPSSATQFIRVGRIGSFALLQLWIPKSLPKWGGVPGTGYSPT